MPFRLFLEPIFEKDGQPYPLHRSVGDRWRLVTGVSEIVNGKRTGMSRVPELFQVTE